MHGLMIATYVLKAQCQNAPTADDFLADQVESHGRARRALVSLAASLAGVTACFVAIGLFR
jgi:hypothetical protein